MAQIVDHLAELTGFRDRDLLDTPLVTALRELLNPRSVAACHCVGEDTSAHEAFARADNAVYWAKDHSRNCLASYSAPVAGGELQPEHHSGDVELL